MRKRPAGRLPFFVFQFLLHVRIALIVCWAIVGTVDEALVRSRGVLAALEAL